MKVNDGRSSTGIFNSFRHTFRRGKCRGCAFKELVPYTKCVVGQICSWIKTAQPVPHNNLTGFTHEDTDILMEVIWEMVRLRQELFNLTIPVTTGDGDGEPTSA